MLGALLPILPDLSAAAAHEGQDHQAAVPGLGAQQVSKPKSYTRTEQDYRIPDVILTDMNGNKAPLRDLLDGEGPVLMELIFTTCATICPVLSASFATSQGKLSAVEPGYRMVSISIDPEHDTPARLRAYAERFGAGDQWQFLTGGKGEVQSVQKAFDAYYRGNNKMYHRPYTYLRGGAGKPWVRIDGLLGSADLVAEYRRVVAPADH
jgi:protein SCO1/2